MLNVISKKPIFKNRSDAGKKLAQKLKNTLYKYSSELSRQSLVVVGLPSGGVPVAIEISEALDIPMDILFVKKIGVPGNSEIAVGALSEGPVVVWQEELLDWLDLSKKDLLPEVKRLKKEIQKLRRDWIERPRQNLQGKIVVVVDDGLATGATMKAATEVIRAEKPKKIIAAVPVASIEALKEFATITDEFIALKTPSPFRSVSHWYEDFTQIDAGPHLRKDLN